MAASLDKVQIWGSESLPMQNSRSMCFADDERQFTSSLLSTSCLKGSSGDRISRGCQPVRSFENLINQKDVRSCLIHEINFAQY